MESLANIVDLPRADAVVPAPKPVESPAVAAAAQPHRGLLDTLKDYKELIVIMTLFASGFLWIYGVFATKDQTKALRCLMNANISALDSQIAQQQFSQLLVENLEAQQALKASKKTLSDADNRKLAQLVAANKLLDEQMSDSNRKHGEAAEKLRTGCDGG